MVCQFCGYEFDDSCGKYGCPNCLGEGLDDKGHRPKGREMTHKLPFTQAAYTEITDADYPPVQETNMKTVTHKLWPVSYINDDGSQVDSLYTFNPKRVDPSYIVGEPINLGAQHPDDMLETHKAGKVADLKAKLAKLEGDDET